MKTSYTELAGLLRRLMLEYPSRRNHAIDRNGDAFPGEMESALPPAFKEVLGERFSARLYLGRTTFLPSPLLLARDKSLFPLPGHGLALAASFAPGKDRIHLSLVQEGCMLARRIGKACGSLFMEIASESIRRILREETGEQIPGVSGEGGYLGEQAVLSPVVAIRYSYLSLQDDLLALGSRILCRAYRAFLAAIGGDYDGFLISLGEEIMRSEAEILRPLQDSFRKKGLAEALKGRRYKKGEVEESSPCPLFI